MKPYSLHIAENASFEEMMELLPDHPIYYGNIIMRFPEKLRDEKVLNIVLDSMFRHGKGKKDDVMIILCNRINVYLKLSIDYIHLKREHDDRTLHLIEIQNFVASY